MDFITGLPTCHTFNAIYTCIDRLTKMVRVLPCFMGEGELTAKDTASLFFDAVVRQHGVPDGIVHDRDPRFTS